MPAMISFRSVVDPSDCDFLGHMNVSRYFAACADGVIAIQSEMGLTANDMRSGRRLSFAVVNAQSDFRAELSAGDKLLLREQFAGKVALQTEQQVQAQATRFRGNAVNSVKAQKLFFENKLESAEKAFQVLEEKVTQFETEIASGKQQQ